VLADGLEVHPERMRVNLTATGGLLFADSAASRLASLIGRDRAHELVESAAGRVRKGGGSLQEILAADPAVHEAGAEKAIEAAFDLSPALDAAALWAARAGTAANRLIPGEDQAPMA
jgi:3-carboxy-cis,cis-muconate cycloisomerase